MKGIVLAGGTGTRLYPLTGFLALSDNVVFAYKCDDVYHPNDEGGLMWDDPEIGIVWPALPGDKALDRSRLVISDKDKRHVSFKEQFGGIE